MRLLVVEDSQRLRETLVDGLRVAGYAVDAVSDGREGLTYARAVEYDLIVLDIMLPELDGLTMLRRFREAQGRAPVLILSALDRVEHRVQGLRGGADDYLVKPFGFEELLARIEALCRRAHGVTASVISVGDVQLDLSAKVFRVLGRELVLAPREYAILEYLFLNIGRVLSRAELEEHVYAADRQVWSNAVDSAIAAIRRRLASAGAANLIQTRRGHGYLVEHRDAASDEERT
jgi:DNA-binding response OmpR family regulator